MPLISFKSFLGKRVVEIGKIFVEYWYREWSAIWVLFSEFLSTILLFISASITAAAIDLGLLLLYNWLMSNEIVFHVEELSSMIKRFLPSVVVEGIWCFNHWEISSSIGTDWFSQNSCLILCRERGNRQSLGILFLWLQKL